MIWAGLEVMGEVPFTDVIIHSTVLATDGRRMSKSLGTGVDPLEMIDAHGADATRYGLLKISSTQDVRFSSGAIEEGRQAREQALERLAVDPAERRDVEPAVDPTRCRGAVDPRADRCGARAGRGGLGGVRFRDRDERALSPHVRRLLRLVRGGGQAAPLRARARRVRDGARGTRAPARAPAPGDAARDRGDLVPPSRRAPASDRVGLAGRRRPVPARTRTRSSASRRQR